MSAYLYLESHYSFLQSMPSFSLGLRAFVWYLKQKGSGRRYQGDALCCRIKKAMVRYCVDILLRSCITSDSLSIVNSQQSVRCWSVQALFQRVSIVVKVTEIHRITHVVVSSSPDLSFSNYRLGLVYKWRALPSPWLSRVSRMTDVFGRLFGPTVVTPFTKILCSPRDPYSGCFEVLVLNAAIIARKDQVLCSG